VNGITEPVDSHSGGRAAAAGSAATAEFFTPPSEPTAARLSLTVTALLPVFAGE